MHKFKTQISPIENPILELVLCQFIPIYITKYYLCNDDFKNINPYHRQNQNFLFVLYPLPITIPGENQSQSSATVRQRNTQQETCSPTLILTLGTASTGARGKSMGSVAASWKPTTRARGLQPSRSAACDVISTRAAAASFRVEALPAVTVPFSFCEAHKEVTVWWGQHWLSDLPVSRGL